MNCCKWATDAFIVLSALEHERQLHLPRAKQFANDFHPLQQQIINDVQR